MVGTLNQGYLSLTIDRNDKVDNLHNSLLNLPIIPSFVRELGTRIGDFEFLCRKYYDGRPTEITFRAELLPPTNKFFNKFVLKYQ